MKEMWKRIVEKSKSDKAEATLTSNVILIALVAAAVVIIGATLMNALSERSEKTAELIKDSDVKSLVTDKPSGGRF